MRPERLYSDEIAPLLAAGEQLACAVTVSYFAGEERSAPVTGVTFDPLNGLDVGAWNAAAERMVGGVSLIGAPGSMGHALRDAFGAFNGGANHLLLTGGRLMAAELTSEKGRVVWQSDRSALAGVRHQPRALQRGRVVLGFSDGSVLALLAGMFFAGEARRLVAAAG
ncbi:hypothetical protein SAMN02745244_01846 [Tessaracoccus bendigoensis DSM 12906]|uniref:Uncharacterized protein n=1 Tax=Tessaracoccus bendigoensis DSM 12906 TaxID=1123357 RepID=A0A1M6H085_9ACTN|nr:hypothetical protein [Tessaracoccus bendigoensis]SHJ15580.1 hypothetical protein SAMN02745244_01846 [Tessaracoccus bendigoensis DSM 12906]